MIEINTLRRIVINRQFEEIDGRIIDIQTANLLVKIHDALDPDRQQKLMQLDIAQATNFAWKVAFK